MTIARWNLLIYAIAGDTKEHQRILTAIEDMRSALTSDQCNIAVQVMAEARTTRTWISSNAKARTEVLDELADASHQGALTSFIDAAGQTFRAASTALVLWAHGSGLDHIGNRPGKRGLGGSGGLGHGGGLGHAGGLGDASGLGDGRALGREAALRQAALRGQAPLVVKPPGRPESYGCRWGPDPNSGRFLTNVTLKQAIAASVRRRVDLLGLNACWMAMLEIEYEMRNVTTVQVASQVYAMPWPYRAIVESLSRKPAQSAAQLAQAIVASVGSEIALGQRQDAVSAFRSGLAMDALAAAFERYAQRVTVLIETDWPAIYQAVMTDAQRMDDAYEVDLASLISVLGAHDRRAAAAAAAVAAQLDAMRIGNAVHPAHPGLHGLSILCPKTTEIDLAAAYDGTEFHAHGWATFLVKFQHRLASS
jgi:hypothetical protein